MVPLKRYAVEMVRLHWFSVLAVAGEMSLKAVLSSVCYHIEVEAMHFHEKNFFCFLMETHYGTTIMVGNGRRASVSDGLDVF